MTKTVKMKPARGLASVLFLLAVGSMASAGTDFKFPTLNLQPVTIQQLVPSDNRYTLKVFNRSSKRVRGISFTIAGTACTPPYKPLWPIDERDGLDIGPGAAVAVEISKNIVDGVTTRSEASCGRSVSTEITVERVRFADGSKWDLGDRVRAGETYGDP